MPIYIAQVKIRQPALPRARPARNVQATSHKIKTAEGLSDKCIVAMHKIHVNHKHNIHNKNGVVQVIDEITPIRDVQNELATTLIITISNKNEIVKSVLRG